MQLKHIKIVTFLTIIFILFCIAYYFITITKNARIGKNSSEHYITEKVKFSKVKQLFTSTTTETNKLKNPNKLIFYASKWFGSDDMGLGLGSDIFSTCKYNQCYATNNITYVPFQEFDAVILHTLERKLYDFSKLRRLPHQVFILTNQESPHYRSMMPFYSLESNIIFNWTMTYRLDSDIPRPYGIVKPQKTNYMLPTLEAIGEKLDRNKTTIAWFVSHCETESLREVIVKHLQNLINIDIYGACGSFHCSKSDQLGCYKFLEKNYMFYLSFENDYCKNYVTEKLFNILKYNVVPIVYGGANYKEIVPKNSIIDVADYDTPEDLVKYLQILLENPVEYLKYFEWKKDYIIDTSNQYVLCNLCEKLHRPIETKFYKDLQTWWNNSTCFYPPNISKLLFN